MLRQAGLLILGFLPLLATAQDIGCFIPGSCGSSTEIGVSFPSDGNGCLQDCMDNPSCFYFTYEFQDDVCVMFTECDNLVNTASNETVSGHRACTPLVCGDQGECEGTLLGVEIVADEMECQDACVADGACTWWSYDADGSSAICSLTRDCERVDTSCSDCSYGQRECQEGAPATGAPGVTTSPGPPAMATLLVFGDDRTVDVISLEGKTCDPVSDLPVTVSYTYSFSVDGGQTPVVCYQTYCYEYDGSSWNSISGPTYSRYLAAGAQVDSETYWAIGGSAYDTSGETYRRSTGVWSLNDPAAPEDMYRSCAAPYNDNEIYITGDYSSGSGYNDFYKYDWTTGSFSTLLAAPYSHTDGVCGVVESSNGPEFVVAGDYDYIDIFNINSNSWRTEGSISSAVTGAAYTQYMDTFIYLGGSSSTNIYEWDSSTDSFTTRSETMPKVRSSYPSAVIIDGTLLNCR